jgi:hypothetical protein
MQVAATGKLWKRPARPETKNGHWRVKTVAWKESQSDLTHLTWAVHSRGGVCRFRGVFLRILHDGNPFKSNPQAKIHNPSRPPSFERKEHPRSPLDNVSASADRM